MYVQPTYVTGRFGFTFLDADSETARPICTLVVVPRTSINHRDTVEWMRCRFAPLVALFTLGVCVIWQMRQGFDVNVQLPEDEGTPRSDDSSDAMSRAWPGGAEGVSPYYLNPHSWSPPTRRSGKPFLVVIGIPTVDDERWVGEQRRLWQRQSWHSYRAVWNRKTNLDGEVVVNYLLGYHPRQQPSYHLSSRLLKEAEQYRDVIILNIREGNASGTKVSGKGGHWGLPAEVGMTRKGFVWLRFATTHFAGRAHYIMKGDDDVFLRVPLYVRDLRRIHATVPRAYYGLVMKWFAQKGVPSTRFYFVGGMAILLAFDVASDIANDPLTGRLLGSFDPAQEPVYKQNNFDHEDVAVGRVLYRTRTNVSLIRDCRMHDVHAGQNKGSIRSNSMIVHHLRQSEYMELRQRWDEDNLPESSLTRGTVDWRLC